MELLHESFLEVKVIGSEISDGLYKTAVTILCVVTNVRTAKHASLWHETLENYCRDVLKATRSHVRCIKRPL